MIRWRAVAAMVGVTVVLLTSCSSDTHDPSMSTTTPSVTRDPSPPTDPPPADACYHLSFGQAVAAVVEAAVVPCAVRHTSRTFHVGTIDGLVDGHLLALDSTMVQDEVRAVCRRRLEKYLGGAEEGRRLARFAPVWFAPSLSDADRGADWFRCDVVLVSGPNRLGALPRRIRGVLDDPAALKRFGTCGTAAPAESGFRRVSCDRKHSWRAQATIDIPADTAHLDESVTSDSSDRCRDIAADLAADPLRLRWSFEWPTQEQWRTGQRYGYCWTPDPA